MALDIDLSAPMRGLDGHRGLVRAVAGAHPSDESAWLEWKTDLDLNTKPGCFAVAKAILGFANRPVEVASLAWGGVGYLVVGVEPENLCGVDVPDPSKWIGRVEVYVKGDAGPAWGWTIVPVDDTSVLIVHVDPPAHGDPPWPLRKEFDVHRSGTLFVRKAGKTEPAQAKDVDALGRRALIRASELPLLTVEVVGDVPLSWVEGVEVRDQIAHWAERERERHIAAARAVEEDRNRPPDPLDVAVKPVDFLAQQAQLRSAATNMAEIMRSASLGQFQAEPDERTLDQYIDEVDSWAGRLKDSALIDLQRRLFESGHGVVHVRVSNASDQYLAGVEIRLHIAFDRAKGFDELPGGERLPKPPWPYGKAKPPVTIPTGLLQPFLPDFADIGGYMRDTSVEDGSIKVTLDVEELRPKSTYDGDDFYILLPVRPPADVLLATWTATVRHRNGIIEGEANIPINAQPTDIDDVLPNIVDGDE